MRQVPSGQRLPRLRSALCGAAVAAARPPAVASAHPVAHPVADGELGPTELVRLADRVGNYDVPVAMGLREPIRGPRAVLGGRAGTVIGVGTGEKAKGKIRVRWELKVLKKKL